MSGKEPFRSNHFHWTNTSRLTSVPIPGDMPAPHLRWQIVVKTGVSELEWASMYLPVLGVVESIDERWQTESGLSFCTVNRAHLAYKLDVNPAVNFGVQLYNKRVLTGPEAIFIDNDFFRDCDTWRVHFKIETEDDGVCMLIEKLEREGLIERWWVMQRAGTAFYANVGSTRLTNLFRALDPAKTTLVSLNGAILYS